MKRGYLETILGILIIVVATFFGLFMMKFVNKISDKDSYNLIAKFDNVEGIGVGSKVKIGGLDVGNVIEQSIDKNYKVVLKLKINKDIKVPVDSNITITTSGLIGAKFLKINIGGDDEYLKNGDEFEFTQSTIELEEMIQKFMFNKATKNNI